MKFTKDNNRSPVIYEGYKVNDRLIILDPNFNMWIYKVVPGKPDICIRGCDDCSMDYKGGMFYCHITSNDEMGKLVTKSACRIFNFNSIMPYEFEDYWHFEICNEVPSLFLSSKLRHDKGKV